MEGNNKKKKKSECWGEEKSLNRINNETQAEELLRVNSLRETEWGLGLALY